MAKKIFISYCHGNKKFKDSLLKQLELLKLAGVCHPWDDSQINTGSPWFNEIECVLHESSIVVLMVSEGFLKSDFIMNTELPIIKQCYEKKKITVFPLFVNRCKWQQNSFINSLQGFPADDTTLEECNEIKQIELIREFSGKIATALKNNEPAQPCLLFSPLPPRVIELIGREEELAQLAIKLNSSERVVLVNGLGGIGKTEVCKTFFMNHYTGYCFAAWVDWISSVRQSLVLVLGDEACGFIETNKTDTEDERFKKILAKLRHMRHSFLLVLDNIENPEDPDLLLLAGLPATVKILTSSRSEIEGYEMLGLDFLSPGQCRELFYRFYTGKGDDEAVKQVVELCGYHTLTVELVAKTAFYAGKSIRWLYETLTARGFNLNAVTDGKIKTFWHNEREKKPFFDHLVKVFDISAVTKAELVVLGNVSLLPAKYISMEWVQEWLELRGMDEIYGLVERGWFKRDGEARIYMHPVIQEVVRYRFKPNAEKCRVLIGSLTWKLKNNPGDNPLDKKEFVPFAESVVSGLATEEKDAELATLANNLSTIYWAMGQLERALEFQLKALTIREKILGENHPDLASSYNNVCTIYYNMGQLERALEFQLKALTIWEKSLGENHPDLATSYNNISMIYQDMGQLERALEFQLKALTIQEKILGENHPSLATSYHNLSTLYLDKKDYPAALSYSAKAVAIMKKLFPGGHHNLTIFEENMAVIKEYL